MASPIIAAVRARRDLKESVVHTAQELAHLASIYGVARVSYRYLAQKCHCSRRTAMRHIARLIELKIIRKSVLWTRANWAEWNKYTFRLDWKKAAIPPPGDKMHRNLPPPEEREKTESLGEEINALERGLRFATPGAYGYQESVEKLETLRQLVRGGKEEMG